MPNKTELSILLIIIGEIGIFLFPTLKVLCWGLYFVSIFFLPWHRISKLNQKLKILIGLLLSMGIFNIMRGLNNLNGQSLLTVIGNPGFSLFEIMPVFILLSTSLKIFNLLKTTIIVTLIISVIALIYSNSLLLIHTNIFFLGILIGIKHPKYLLLYFCSTIVAIYIFVAVDFRLIIIPIILLVPLIILNKIPINYGKFVFFIKIYNAILLITPIIMVVTSILVGSSIFEYIQDNSSDNIKTRDTRTFLFIETFNDLISSNSMITGKGSTGRISTVLSDEIDQTIINGKRAFVEVLLLEFMRRGGIIYALLFYFTIISSVRYVTKNARNRTIQSFSVTLSIFYFITFIGINPIFSLHFVFLWILIGICHSKIWNQISDFEIKNIVLKL